MVEWGLSFIRSSYLYHWPSIVPIKPPLAFAVGVPDYPFFHPKDAFAIVSIIGLPNCTTYGIYDGNIWLITSLAQRVKANALLLLRSSHVSRCPELDSTHSILGKRHISPSDIVESLSKKSHQESSADNFESVLFYSFFSLTCSL